MKCMQNPIISIGKVFFEISIYSYNKKIPKTIFLFVFRTFLVGVGAPPNSSLGFLEMSIIASLLLLFTITMILIFCIFMRWMSNKRNAIIYGQ